MVLTVAAVGIEAFSPFASLTSLYVQRRSPSSGLALGALTIPWVSAALVTTTATTTTTTLTNDDDADYNSFSMVALHLSLASSALALGFIFLKSSSTALRARNQPPSTTSTNGTPTPTPINATSRLMPITTRFTTLFNTISICIGIYALITGSDTDLMMKRAQAAGASATAVATLHLLLTLLPRTFTLGEALVASQVCFLLFMIL